MAVKPEQVVSDLCRQAVETFDATLKAGVKLQEEAAKIVTDSIGGVPSPQEWRQRANAIVKDAVPTARKNAEEYLRVIDQNTRNSLDLLKKAFDAGQFESITEAQAKTQELWEASLNAVRASAEATVQANTKAVEAWVEFAKRTASCNGQHHRGGD